METKLLLMIFYCFRLSLILAENSDTSMSTNVTDDYLADIQRICLRISTTVITLHCSSLHDGFPTIKYLNSFEKIVNVNKLILSGNNYPNINKGVFVSSK